MMYSNLNMWGSDLVVEDETGRLDIIEVFQEYIPRIVGRGPGITWRDGQKKFYLKSNGNLAEQSMDKYKMPDGRVFTECKR